MSFWKTFGFHAVSAIDTILDGGDFTLEQLLDEEEILQETKSQNKKLLDFLVEPATLKKLVEYVTVEAKEEEDPKRKFKYPFLACEILASEVWAICDAMYQHQDLLDELYAYFEKEPPLSPLLSSYTSRVATILLQKKVPETIGYLKTKKTIVSQFLKHLGNASIMDLLLKIIACEDQSEGAGVLEWLCSTELIASLVNKFDPKLPSSVHENAMQALGDIIAVSMNNNSPLIAQLESEGIIKIIFEHILAAGLGTSLENGLSVIVDLLRRHTNESMDDLTKIDDLPPLFKIILANLDKLHELLRADNSNSKEEEDAKSPSAKSLLTLPLPIGEIKKLGFARLKIVEFFTALIHTNYLCVTLQLLSSNVVSSCVKEFFEHPWNNFLHATVEQMIQVLLDSDNEDLKLKLVSDCKLVDLICEASRLSEEDAAKPKGVRRGYMGHITNISSSLLNTSVNTPAVEKYLSAHEEWNKYCKGSFQQTRDKETKPLSYAPEEFTGEDQEELEDEFDNGEEANTIDQEFKLEDEDEDEDEDEEDEGIIVPRTSIVYEEQETWEEREIQEADNSTTSEESEKPAQEAEAEAEAETPKTEEANNDKPESKPESKPETDQAKTEESSPTESTPNHVENNA